MVLAVGIKHPLHMSVQGSHDPDPREHRWPVMLGDQDQRLHRSLPLWSRVFSPRELGDVGSGVPQRRELPSVRQVDWILERRRPGHSTIAHRCDRFGVPVKIGPHLGAFLAAALTDKARLKIGEPDVIRPLVCADRSRMAAMIIGTINQETADARRAHFGEGDLLDRGWRHGASMWCWSRIFEIAGIRQVSSQSLLDKVGN